jgi:hypothetical protein
VGVKERRESSKLREKGSDKGEKKCRDALGEPRKTHSFTFPLFLSAYTPWTVSPRCPAEKNKEKGSEEAGRAKLCGSGVRHYGGGVCVRGAVSHSARFLLNSRKKKEKFISSSSIGIYSQPKEKSRERKEKRRATKKEHKEDRERQSVRLPSFTQENRKGERRK